MKRLVKFEWDCGRMGDLEGHFILDDEQWILLQDIIKNKKEIYFGEVLGKHSEIFGVVAPEDITVITDNQEWLATAEEIGVDFTVGYNPLDYYEPSDEE